jgi:acetylornithine deacetylase/succinyl-diaminopimelate desuccinylase-like protein
MAFDLDWLAASSDAEEAATLTSNLVSHRSYPGEEAGVQQAVATWFTNQGLNAEIVPTAEPDRPNVTLQIDNGTGPTFLINGHVDTVLKVEGWESDPWTPRRDADRLYGLGACDMKSGVAAAMMAIRALAARRDLWQGKLIFSSVVDEEAYSLGAHALIDSGLHADYCVVTEASWDKPCLGSVGKILVRLDVQGRAAHATWPHLGVNAAIEASRFVARLAEIELGQHPRMNSSQTVLSFLSGNEQYVVTVPEKARVLINRHTVPGESVDHVLAQYRALAAELDSPADFTFTVDPPFYPPWETETSDPVALAFARAYEAEAGIAPTYGYHGFGDMNLFSSEAGIPTVMVGPRGGGFHEANEWVDVPSIGATVRVLLHMVCDLLPAGS